VSDAQLAGGVLLLVPLAALIARCCLLTRAVSTIDALAWRLPIGGAHSGERAARFVDGIGRRVRARCLTKALVLHAVLNRMGTASQLVVGASLQSGRLRSHAWVERNGQSLLGSTAEWMTVWRISS
jgi:hypothetical protein